MVIEHLSWLRIVRWALFLSSHLILTITWEEGVRILTSQMRKLRSRNVMESIQDRSWKSVKMKTNLMFGRLGGGRREI